MRNDVITMINNSLEDITVESEYLVLTDLLNDYSKMLIMEQYVMEANQEKSSDNIFTKIKNAILKVIDMIINVIKKIGNGFRNLKNKRYQRTIELLDNEGECERLGRRMEEVASTITTEYFVQEEDVFRLDGKGEVWKLANPEGVDLNKQMWDALKSAKHIKTYDTSIGPTKPVDSSKSFASKILNTLSNISKDDAISSVKETISSPSTMVNIGMIIICAKILIAIARKANHKFPTPEELISAFKDLDEQCITWTNFSSSINQMRKNTSQESINDVLHRRIPKPFILSGKTMDTVDRANNWKREYDKQKSAFDGSRNTLTNKQTSILVDAVWFSKTIKGSEFWNALNDLDKSMKSLKSEIQQFTVDQMTNVINRKIYTSITTLSKTCVDLVMEVQFIQTIGSEMIKNIDLSIKQLHQFESRENARNKHK